MTATDQARHLVWLCRHGVLLYSHALELADDKQAFVDELECHGRGLHAWVFEVQPKIAVRR